MAIFEPRQLPPANDNARPWNSTCALRTSLALKTFRCIVGRFCKLAPDAQCATQAWTSLCSPRSPLVEYGSKSLADMRGVTIARVAMTWHLLLGKVALSESSAETSTSHFRITAPATGGLRHEKMLLSGDSLGIPSCNLPQKLFRFGMYSPC